jgi:hypothetical protein
MKCKKVFDGRQLPRKAKEQLRIAAVKRVEAGESPEFVAAGLGTAAPSTAGSRRFTTAASRL